MPARHALPRKVPEELLDPLTLEVMNDPVICADGHSYERANIERWLLDRDTSPRTGAPRALMPSGDGRCREL